MNTLIPQMAEFLKESEPAPGVPARAVNDVLLALATSAIQQDPTQATIPPEIIDPAIIAAIQSAVDQVAVLKKTLTRVRVQEETLPVGNTAAVAEQASEIFGPFVRRSGELVRYANFRSAAILAVEKLVPPNTSEDQIVIPAASTPDAPDFRNWTLAPGTVWINSRFLVAGATGFTGLRISGGRMQLADGTFRFGSGIVIPAGSEWSISVEPEAPPPAEAGSDGDALALTLPTQLNVSSSGAPTVTGAPVLSGFGSDLHFTFSGSPVLEGDPVLEGEHIAFPMVAAEPTFSLKGNVSKVARFSGEASVTSARWTLPISSTPLVSLANAAHGGSMVVHLGHGIEATLMGQQGGPFQLLFKSLTANAQRIEMDCAQASSVAHYNFDLWNTSSASVRFKKGPAQSFSSAANAGASISWRSASHPSAISGICPAARMANRFPSRAASISSISSAFSPTSNAERQGNFGDLCPSSGLLAPDPNFPDCPVNPSTGQYFAGYQVPVDLAGAALKEIIGQVDGKSEKVEFDVVKQVHYEGDLEIQR